MISGRNILSYGWVYQLVIQDQMDSPEYIHTGNITQTKYVILM